MAQNINSAEAEKLVVLILSSVKDILGQLCLFVSDLLCPPEIQCLNVVKMVSQK
jgi:hypothetical protein